MDKSKSANIAKWGAACSACAIAKAKCLRSNDRPGTKCDRCERLEKDCLGQVHRPRKKRQTRPSKTAQLEERLNSLVDYIKSNNSGEVPASLSRPSEVRQAASSPGGSEGTTSSQSQGEVLGNPPTQASECKIALTGTIPTSYNVHAPRVCVCRSQAGEALIPFETDEASLSTYTNRLMPNYPFVIIPPGTTPSELAQKRPLLFTTIRMVSSYRNLKSMRSQKYFILRQISEQMLMRSERSLDILQSILLVLGYYHYHCMIHAQMNNLIGLANSLVADLGINKDPDSYERTRLLVSHVEAPRARTNEEKRALCGVWYVTSMVALAFQRIDPPKYTAYIDQCVRELEAEGEYETDSLLVNLVRIQHLSERIAQLRCKDNTADDLAGATRAPTSVYSSMFYTELERLRVSLPPKLASNGLIICHINTAKLRLWEPPRTEAALLEKISNSLASLSLDSTSSLDVFYQSNAALKSWFEAWLAIEVTDYFVLPMPISAQLINAVIMLARWSKLSYPERKPSPISTTTAQPQIVRNDPGCSGAAMVPVPAVSTKEIDPAIPAAVRTIRAHLLSQPELQIDVSGILQAMVERFEHARDISEGQGDTVWENDTWVMAAKKLRGTRLKLERWAELVTAASSENRRPESSTDTNTTGDPNLGSGQAVEGHWPIGPIGVAPFPEDWSPGVLWDNDFFEGLGMDQNFFDGPGDYGTAVLNSL
ncbi:uncharacterized protein F4822DRAFT_419463 [Hypoxylon trugodes]|uniref:uncharacterized protein n=1 Tax=Hypoxylon trugodes TaxID=326681 RepID=UPI0021927064|nr:uncharacterized protein F4822DRAFT_419463 [Hypoxylon trugodes]KAI1384343.1 hypothetical protein F4822DRAFT_419463 [Hypoxylon trugodes]